MLIKILSQDLTEAKTELQQKNNVITKLTNDNQNLILELTSQKRDNYNLSNQLNEYATNLASNRTSIDNLSTERTTLKNEIASLKERLKALNEQREIDDLLIDDHTEGHFMILKRPDVEAIFNIAANYKD